MTHNDLVTGRWNDENCDEKRGWVCYKKKCEISFVYLLIFDFSSTRVYFVVDMLIL